jgi:CHAD domain-containing protein
MQTATETERKYDVPDGFELPPLAGAAGVARAGDAQIHELDATYVDTDDLRLARNRRTLRRRTGGSDAGWHLKTPGDGASRTEWRLPLSDGDDVPAELLAEVRAIVRARPLRQVARLRTRRVETPLCDEAGRTLALVAQDDVTARTDDGEQRWREVEVELVDGAPEVLAAVERRLRRAGARPATGPSKLARALGPRLRAPGQKKVNPVLAYAREQRDAIQAYDPGVRRGEGESVHKMRVATRRLRSTLRTFRGAFAPERAEPVRAELRWLAHELGAVRDGQVLERKLTAAVEAEGPEFAAVADRIRSRLDRTVSDGRRELVAALDGERYLRLLDELDELVDGAPRTAPQPRRQARKALRRADRLLDRARADGADAEFHEARKAYKRARYAVEVFAPAAGAPAGRLVDRLTRLQDVLGDHQDSVVARELLRDLAAEARGAGEDGFPYGILYARQQRVGENTVGDLVTADRRARTRKVRRWLGF